MIADLTLSRLGMMHTFFFRTVVKIDPQKYQIKTTAIGIFPGLLRGPQQPNDPVHRPTSQRPDPLQHSPPSKHNAGQPATPDNRSEHSDDNHDDVHIDGDDDTHHIDDGERDARFAANETERTRTAAGTAQRQRTAAQVQEGPGREAEGAQGRTDRTPAPKRTLQARGVQERGVRRELQTYYEDEDEGHAEEAHGEISRRGGTGLRWRREGMAAPAVQGDAQSAIRLVPIQQGRSLYPTDKSRFVRKP